jgi:4-amino-4-deoxy-L-arabinose transferase-like glycosyltransferase
MVAAVSGSFRARLLTLTLLGLAVRALWVAVEPATSPVADETMWLTWGTEVLPSPEVAFSPLRLRFVFHPPLYLYLLGVPFAATGSLAAVQYLQCLVGVLLVPALGLLGRSTFSEPAGLVAAALAAFYPELVWFAAHFWAETLFTVLLWWALERLVASDARGSATVAAGAGLLFGLATLTRETVLYFLPFAGLWLAWRRPGGLRRAALVVLASLLVVLPWTVRNWLVFDAFVPVSTAGALNLWQGNSPLTRQQVYEEYWAVRGRIPKYEYARARALEAIRERQPLWILEKLRSELPEFWAVHAQPIVHLERGAYGIVRRPLAIAAVAVVLAPYLAVLVLFVVGLARLPSGRAPLLLLAFLLFYVLLHVAAHGYPRYRLPVMPALFLVAAHGAVAWRARPRPATPRARLLAAAAAGLVLALSVAPSLAGWIRNPWPPPWFEGLGIEPERDAPAGDEAQERR